MPSETFFRLPQSKQERIVEAIKNEISQSAFDSFSIGPIIRQCGISRGSFYQYFQNKEDIYLYLISDYQSHILEHGRESIRKNGGNFFATFDDTFRFAVRMLCYKDSKAFRHNLFCNARLYEMLWRRDKFFKEDREKLERLNEVINTDLLRVDSIEELGVLMDICLVTAMKDAAGIFMADDSEQTVLSHFLPKLELLKKKYQKAA